MRFYLILLVLFCYFNTNASILDSLLIESDKHSGDHKIAFFLDNFYPVFSQSYDEGLTLANKSLEASQKLNDSILIGRSYLCIGMANYMLGNYEKCYENYNSALSIFEKTKNLSLIGRTNNELSVYYRKLKQFDKALECLDRSFATCIKCKDSACVETSLNNRAVVYEMKGDFKKAIYFYFKAINMAESNSNKQGLAYIYMDASYCYKLMGKLDSAEILVNKSIMLMRELNNFQGEGLNLINKGDILAEKRNYQEAVHVYNDCIYLAQKLDYNDLRQQAYFQLAQVLNLMGDYEKASSYLVKSYELKDSLLNLAKVKSLSEMEIKYETEKIENNLLIERQNNILNQLKIEQKNKWIIGVISFAVFVALTLFIWYQRSLRVKQSEKDKAIIDERNKGILAVIEATENERQRIAKDLHDGIGQQMSGIKLMLSNLYGDKNHSDTLSKVSNLLDKTSAELRTISHQMMPKVLSAFGVEPAMRQSLEENLISSNIQYEFDYFNLPERLNQEIELVIYRVFQELLNNSIKHSNASKLSIQLYKNQKHLIFVFEDNGTGFKLDENALNGIGITNMKTRLNSVKGEISIDSKISRGTITTIRIPL